MLMNAWILACRAEGKSPLTVDSYRQRIGDFVRFVQQNGGNMGNYEVRLYLVSLQNRGLSKNTVSTYYRIIRTFANWTVAEGLIDSDPIPNVRPPRVPQTKPRPFSPRDIDALLLLTEGKRFVDYRNRALLLVFLDTGLRLAEVAGMMDDDVSFEAEAIRIMGKGAKERTVRIGRATRLAMLRYHVRRTDDYPNFWVSESRTPLTREGLREAIKKLCLRAEITDAKPGPHTLRHTAAINFLRNGGDAFMLQAMLGHSTLTMTRHYTSVIDSADVFEAHRRASPVDRLFEKRRK